MNAFEHFASQWGQAMDILAGACGRSVLELCQAGLDTKMAKQVDKLAGVYFGKTKSTKKQSRARGCAGEQGHTLFTLAEIETIVGRLKDKKHAWKVRVELCKEPPIMRTLQERGKALIEEFNGPEVPENKPSMSATAIPGSTYVNFRACAPGYLVQAAMDALNAEESEEHPAERAMKILAGGGSAGGPPVTPAVIISLEDLAKVEGYEGDDVILSLTNGTRMTGKEFVEAKMTEKGYVMLVDPVEGPVNVYYGSRSATPKQRLMRKICDPVCVGDGCGVGADYCQMNHNVAWSAGGPTNINNLSTMCSFHNGRMDDDRGSPLHGHVDQVNGQVYFFPPFGGKPRLNDHPVARGGAMRVV